MTLSELDLLLRYAALGLLCTAALNVMRLGRTRPSAAIAGLAITLSCYLLVSSPHVAWSTGISARMLEVGAALSPFFLTWAIIELLSDTPRPYWPLICASAVGALLSFLIPLHSLIGPVRGLTVAGVYVGLLIIVSQGDRDDLVDKRRRLRRAILIAMLALGIGITAVEITFGSTPLPGHIYVLQAAAFLALGLAAVFWVSTPAGDLWRTPMVQQPAGNPADRAAVLVAMEEGAWRTEGLTVSELARDLGIADHHLRRVINQDLGFRNFSTFLNSYRIAHACERLADPNQQGVTILEIAYDSGFASLSPFNKAFRAAEGCSPTEFRARR